MDDVAVAGPGRASKRYWRGTHRVRTPQETLAAFRPHMERCGITRLACLTGLDSIGIPVYAAVRPLARSLVISLGKGVDSPAAMASALMESIEVWHAEQVEHDGRPVLRDTADGLARRGLHAVEPARLGLALGAAPSEAYADAWIEGTDLMSGRPCWVPLDAVSLDFTVDRPATAGGLLRSSNGLASGNQFHEALVHGLCEVVERDAETIWRHCADYRRVDPATVTAPDGRALLRRLADADVHAAIWDITSDVGVPAYGCVLMENPNEPGWRSVGVHDGFGCHLSPDVALVRAVTEAAQTRLTYISGSRDDLDRAELDRANSPDLAHQVWDELTAVPCTVAFPDTSERAGATLDEDLDTLLGRLAAAGCEQAVAVDLTADGLGVPVVKVLVPGLEGPYGECEPGPRAAAAEGLRAAAAEEPRAAVTEALS
ncbi:YcaO-domain protein [Actinobacteria bacterium OK074]|nr:YcaO-domain protein [Actinobacteria bacterium OK074]